MPGRRPWSVVALRPAERHIRRARLTNKQKSRELRSANLRCDAYVACCRYYGNPIRFRDWLGPFNDHLQQVILHATIVANHCRARRDGDYEIAQLSLRSSCCLRLRKMAEFLYRANDTPMIA